VLSPALALQAGRRAPESATALLFQIAHEVPPQNR